MRLVQIQRSGDVRKLALVDEPHLILLHPSISSVYDLALQVIHDKQSISQTVQDALTEQKLYYDEIYHSRADWKLLPAVDHPSDPMQCMVSGTGLTHKASAENRQKMHEHQESTDLTDSMQMYLWGEEGGKPRKGNIGVQPEWFYKGNGSILRGHGSHLEVPAYANDGGEEPEIAGIYIVGEDHKIYRIGIVQGNEFSDHVMEKKNYLYLAPSKLRQCAIGPEINLDFALDNIRGEVEIRRNGHGIWSKEIGTGEQNMSHSIQNLEYHHFKYPQHRMPGQLHVHFFGADAFSFGANIALQDKDEMRVSFENMGRALVNPVAISKLNETMIPIESLNNIK